MDARDYLSRHGEEALAELLEFARMASVSADSAYCLSRIRPDKEGTCHTL
jgi:hypothetical protein